MDVVSLVLCTLRNGIFVLLWAGKPLLPHKPEAPAKENAALRWRFRLVCQVEIDHVILVQAPKSVRTKCRRSAFLG